MNIDVIDRADAALRKSMEILKGIDAYEETIMHLERSGFHDTAELPPDVRQGWEDRLEDASNEIREAIKGLQGIVTETNK